MNLTMLKNWIFEFEKGSLILLSWISGSWKSTFKKKTFEKNGYSDYVISSDELRVRYFWVLNEFDEDWNIIISTDQNSSKLVFDMMYWIAKYRCENKLTTVIDAMNLTDDVRKNFIKLWNWTKVYTIIFSDEYSIERNNSRKNKIWEFYVPEKELISMKERFNKSTSIKWNIIVKAEDIEDVKEIYKTITINDGELLYIVGDTHGIENFESYIEDMENKSWGKPYKFIFLWDIVDRWNKSIENLIYLLKRKETSPDLFHFIMWNHDYKLLRNINTYLFEGWKINEKVLAWYKTLKSLLEYVQTWVINIHKLKAFLESFEDFIIVDWKDKYFLSHAPFLLPDNIWNIRSSDCLFWMEKFRMKNSHKLDDKSLNNFLKALREYSINKKIKIVFWHIDLEQDLMKEI